MLEATGLAPCFSKETQFSAVTESLSMKRVTVTPTPTLNNWNNIYIHHSCHSDGAIINSSTHTPLILHALLSREVGAVHVVACALILLCRVPKMLI